MSEHKWLNLRGHLAMLAIIAVVALAVPAAVATFIGSGIYNIGADAPHTKPVFWLIGQLRDHSIAVRARGLAPPANLSNPGNVAAGAHLYDKLCTGCHLAPDMEETDLARGLYPKAPPLAYGTNLTPGQEFWVIKHGVKLTAMPAWGRSHGDAEVWDLVAFLKAMPRMDGWQYKAAASGAPPAATK